MWESQTGCAPNHRGPYCALCDETTGDVPGTIAEPLPEGVPQDRYFFRRYQG